MLSYPFPLSPVISLMSFGNPPSDISFSAIVKTVNTMSFNNTGTKDIRALKRRYSSMARKLDPAIEGSLPFS